MSRRIAMAKELAEHANRLRAALWAGVVSIGEAQAWLFEASELIAGLCRV